MDIRLIVIRSGDAKRLADFYGLLGLTFNYHKHGSSPYHYGALIGQTVLEIYPLAKNQIEPDKNLRLGFSVDGFEETIDKLKTSGIVFSAEPVQTDFGLMAVAIDPDGRKIELYKK